MAWSHVQLFAGEVRIQAQSMHVAAICPAASLKPVVMCGLALPLQIASIFTILPHI